MEFCEKKNCADCCEDAAVPLLNSDIDMIVLHGYYDVFFVEENNGIKTLRTKTDGSCVFFNDETKACEIEQSKPERCKLNPYCICDKNPKSYEDKSSPPEPKTRKETKMMESMTEFISKLQREVEWRRRTGNF